MGRFYGIVTMSGKTKAHLFCAVEMNTRLLPEAYQQSPGVIGGGCAMSCQAGANVGNVGALLF